MIGVKKFISDFWHQEAWLVVCVYFLCFDIMPLLLPVAIYLLRIDNTITTKRKNKLTLLLLVFSPLGILVGFILFVEIGNLLIKIF